MPLDDKAKIEIQITAQKIRSYNPGYIYSSDLMRDTNTAMIIAQTLNCSAVAPDWRARTWDMGDFEGEKLKDVNPAIEGLYHRPWETPPGSSESYDGFSKRWCDFLDEKMDLAASVPQFRPMVCVTHGKNIALSYSYIEGIAPWDGIMPLPAGYAVIKVNQDRTLGIDMMTETEPVIEDI